MYHQKASKEVNTKLVLRLSFVVEIGFIHSR